MMTASHTPMPPRSIAAVPKQMIFEPARDESRMRSPALVNVVVVLALVAIVAVFVFPNPIARAAEISTLIGG
jgi:hypothetical protein